MATKTFNWCSPTELDCGSSIPTTAYLCVNPSIVSPEAIGNFGYVTVTITAVRASTCRDSCGPCKWVYTISYDDDQLVDGFALSGPDIKQAFCGNCLIDFILTQSSCDKVRECISVEDTDSVDMSFDTSTGVISSDVRINEDESNALMSTSDGLLVTPGAVDCEDVAICIGANFCWNLATTEEELIALNTAGVGGIAVGDSITLADPLTVDIPLTILPCGEIVTDGNVLTINGAFQTGAYQCFDSALNEVLFKESSVSQVLPEWFGAIADATTNSTNGWNFALASTSGVVQGSNGIYLVTGLNIPATSTVTINGTGWDKCILRNSSSVNHTISRAGGANVNSRAIKISNIKLEHTGSGVLVDGIHLQQVNNHIRIERVYIADARRHGIYIEGDEPSFTGSLYTRIEQVWSEGAGDDGVFLNGGCNNATIIGGRFGGNGRYGLNVDDTVTGDPAAFPNTLRVLGTDLPGNDIGLHEAGHSNTYIGLRFEGNTTADINFATKSEAPIFFSPSFSSTPVITGTPSARATIYSKDFSIRQFQDDGYFEYWDEVDGAIRLAPKRSVYNITFAPTSSGGGTVDSAVARTQDPGEVKRVSIIPTIAITGANTNNLRLALRNKKFGGGDVAVAALTFSSGNNAPALTDTEIPLVGGNEAYVDGDILYLEKTENGTGMASSELLLQVEYGGA